MLAEGRHILSRRPKPREKTHFFAYRLTCLHHQTLLVHCFLCFSSMLFQNFPKPPSRDNTSCRYTYVTSTAQLKIFFHVLVYSCQPIVASVRFKVPQVVVRSQSAVVSKIWTNSFNRANDWIGAIKAIALCSRGFSCGSLKRLDRNWKPR